MIAYAIGCALACAWFALVWAWARRRDNWSLVDAAWALGPFLATLPAAVSAEGARDWCWAIGFALWGGRLAAHLHARVGGGRDREDPRYTQLRETWGERAPQRMFWFFQAQAVSVWVLAVPAHLACRDARGEVMPTEWAGAALALVAVAGEAVADRQLKHFRADSGNRGRVCDAGLWAWSRHPNYFFEWLVWCGAALAATAAPWGAVAWTAPAMMLWLLLRVTGVPMAEARARATKGEAWRAYAARTPAFFPRPPRSRPRG